MVHQMKDAQKDLVRDAILDADPAPEDIDDCVQLLMDRKVFSQKKVKAFGAEFRKVCEEALATRDARDAMTPPRSDISPHCSADPVPDTPQDDGALRAAAASCSGELRDIIQLYRSSTRDFHFASVKYANAELSYIQERRLNQLGIQHNNQFIQLGWIYAGVPNDGDHTAKETVFVIVSNDQASRDKMNVDVLLGRCYNEEVEVQLHAVRRSMGLESPPSPCEIQPDDSGSVAEVVMLPTQAAMVPTQAAKSPAPSSSWAFAFRGQNPEQQLANFCKAMDS